MTLLELVHAVGRRWRVLVVVTALGLGAATALVLAATPQYRARAELFVSSTNQVFTTSDAYDGGLLSQGRVQSYVMLVNQQEVLQPVVTQLQLPYSWTQLSKSVSASNPGSTLLISITAQDPSPTRARDIANAVAQRFSAYAQAIESPGSASNAVVQATVAQKAVTPAAPSSPRKLLDLVLGLLAGLVAGTALSVLREVLDTTVDSADQVAALTGLATVGIIPLDPRAEQLPVAMAGERGPDLGREEAFRLLAANLQFMDVDAAAKSLLVTSSIQAEGKSSVACNLAIALAQFGARVILVDADLRRPMVAQYLGLESASGLTTALVGRAPLADLLQPWGAGHLDLRVLASGALPPNPAQLLASEHMGQIVRELTEMADLVIIDGPPLLPVADGSLLAKLTDASILVVRHKHTRRHFVTRAAEALVAADGKPFGTVLNAAKRRRADRDEYTYYAAAEAAPGGQVDLDPLAAKGPAQAPRIPLRPPTGELGWPKSTTPPVTPVSASVTVVTNEQDSARR